MLRRLLTPSPRGMYLFRLVCAVAIVVWLCVMLAGCGESAPAVPTNNAPITTAVPPTIAPTVTYDINQVRPNSPPPTMFPEE